MLNTQNTFLSLLLMSLLISCQQEAGIAEDGQDLLASTSEAPEWTKNKNIYEVNLRQFTQEGTFAAFEKEIPRLKEMGVDILWFMPIHEIGEVNRKGPLGSYYAVKDYKSVNSEFGTAEDFRRLVQTIHDHDMYILIDWVANHTAWDHAWTETNPEFYIKNEDGEFMPPAGTDWEDVIDLDYSNPEVHKAMKDAMVFWVRDYDIDGFRCDVAELVPMDFWNKVRESLDEIKPVFMLAEGEKTELFEAFDMTYAWDVFHTLVDIAGEGNATADTLHQQVKAAEQKLPEGAFRMNFLTNHDENTWKGTIDSLLGPAHEAMAVLTYTFPGMPLIYSGQEANIDQRLEFFERDPIEWGDYEMKGFYTSLNRLKHENEALWNGRFGGAFNRLQVSEEPNVYAFERVKDNSRVITIVNLTDTPKNFTPTQEMEGLNDYFNSTASGLESGKQQQIEAWGYKVLIK